MRDSIVQKMAAYSTIKGLVDSKKYSNQYYILAEFIKYIIICNNKYSFSISDMMLMLEEEFEFEVPYAVVKSSIKKIGGINRNKDECTVVSMDEISEDFSRLNVEGGEEGRILLNKLNDFCIKSNIEVKFIDQLESDFIKYILDRDDVDELKYGDIISKFFISIESDVVLKSKIEKIREGSVIYCGLCYNIIEIGSITKDLVLYLDTEILFFLLGYNGELSKRIALSFIDLVREANKKKHRISLVYFREVKDEIDRYFGAARKIVKDKGGVTASRAMRFIVNGCSEESDVIDKQSDFYYNLEKKFGIYLDENTDKYYIPDNYKYNLETCTLLNDEDPKMMEDLQYISHINVLRKGQEFEDYINSGYIIITQTHKLLSLSNECVPKGRAGYAISISRITNILWMKLGGVLGKVGLPSSADIAVKARMVIDKSVSASINKNYETVILQYKRGVLDEGQTIARLLRLREKIIEPELILESNVDDLMDFSEESLKMYEEAIKIGEKEKEELQKLCREKSELDNQLRIKDSIIDSYKEKAEQDRLQSEKKQIRNYKFLWIGLVIESTIILEVVILFVPFVQLASEIAKGVIAIIGVYGSLCTIFPQFNIFIKLSEYSKENREINIDYTREIPKLIRYNFLLIIILIACGLLINYDVFEVMKNYITNCISDFVYYDE